MESLFTGDQYNLKWNSHKNSLVNLMEDHLTREELVDVTLSCSGKYIRAHKLILSACSSYFREIFRIHKVDNPLIILNNVKYEYLKYIIDFIYSGEMRVKDTDLKEILLLGANLKIRGLSSITDKHIAKTNDEQNKSEWKTKDMNDEVGLVKDKVLADEQLQNTPTAEGSNNKLVENSQTSLSRGNIIYSKGPNSNKVARVVTNQVAQSLVIPKKAVTNVHKMNCNEMDIESPKKKKRKITILKSPKEAAKSQMDPLAELGDSNMLKVEAREFDDKAVDSPKGHTTTQTDEGVALQVKPVSAFMIFANEWRKRLDVEHPTETNKEISVRLSSMWKNLSNETRDAFYETASRVYEDQKQKLKAVKR